MFLQENIQLQSLNTMATPAIARWFVVVQSVADIVQALEFAKSKSCEFLVLGEGSNTLFSGNLDLLLIANRVGGAGQINDLFASHATQVVAETSSTIDISVGAGVSWHQLVEQSINHAYFGLECLALIPGLVGAAPIQNIGAYGAEIKDVLISVNAIDVITSMPVCLPRQECAFAYRDSVFKRKPSRYIITGVTLRLVKIAPTYSMDTIYPALRSELQESLEKSLQKPSQRSDAITPKHVFDAVCKVRSSKLPNPKDVPNSGSFFKNPIVTEDKKESLLLQYPDLVNFHTEEGYKLAAGWLIEQAGLKGIEQSNGVGSYPQQALVLVNRNRATGVDVLNFAEHVKAQVYKKFGVSLEIEPRVYSSDKGQLTG